VKDRQLSLNFDAMAVDRFAHSTNLNIIDFNSYSRAKSFSTKPNAVTDRLLKEAQRLSW